MHKLWWQHDLFSVTLYFGVTQHRSAYLIENLAEDLARGGDDRPTCCLLQQQGRGSWGCDFWALKICGRGQSMFWSPEMSHYFIRNCCWITACLTASRMKDLRQNGWRGKIYFFEGPETVWWLDLTDPDPLILRQMYATVQGEANFGAPLLVRG